MLTDPGLRRSVEAFVNRLAPAVVDLAGHLPDTNPEELRQIVAREAFDLAAAFVDADGLQTDEELWALIGALGGQLPELGRATPAGLRSGGTVAGRRAWLDEPSELWRLLCDADRRDGTRLTRDYYDLALGIAFEALGLDLHRSRAELDAVDTLQRRLLAGIEELSHPSTPAGPTSGGAGGTARPPGARRDGAAGGGATATRGPAEPGTVAGAADGDPPARPIAELLAELEGLVGLAGVKAEVRMVTNLLQVQRLRRERGLPVLERSNHLVFTGNPGTGKTTVARLLAQIYRTLGVVARGQLVETDRSGLVAGFVGQTALKVTETFDRADEGMLLIDEAYALARGGQNDFGQEAIDTIVKLVEDRRDRLVVVAAGYPDEMATFIGSNPGLRSRFPTTIAFADYSDDELVQIFESLGARSGYHCDDDARRRVRAWFGAQTRDKGFGNGRAARNLFEAAVAAQAGRVVQLDEPTDDDLTTLLADDIPGPDPGPGTP